MFRAHPHLREGPASETVRAAVKSLFLLGFFRDLPDQARFDAGVQLRMWRAVPDMESSMAGMASLLENMTPADSARVSARLQADPGLPMRVCESLDNHWCRDALSGRRRAHLRTIVSELAFRLQHQPPSLLIHELVGKYAKATAVPDADARKDEMIKTAGDVTSWASVAPRMKRDADENIDEEIAPLMLVGLGLLGLGAVVFGVSYLIVIAGSFPGLFGMTLGALLLLVGLIIVATGGVMDALEASSKR